LQPDTLQSAALTQTLEAPVPDGAQPDLQPLSGPPVFTVLAQEPAPLEHLFSAQFGSQTTHFPEAVSTSDPASHDVQFSTLSQVLQAHSALHLKQIP